VPTFVWNGLLVPVVVALYGGEQPLLATALLVLGPEAGMELAERESIAAYFLLRLGSEFEERMSSLFVTKVLKE
jgi:thiamine biosynthesis lipoprotein